MRIIVVVAAGIGLAGCSSFSIPSISMPSLDSFKPTPSSVSVQLELLPAGAEARTSTGQSCKTPCAVSIPAENFSVTFTLPKYLPETVAVQVTQQVPNNVAPDEELRSAISIEPNPVYAELQPAPPPKRNGKAASANAPKPKASTANPAAAPSPFPPLPGR